MSDPLGVVNVMEGNKHVATHFKDPTHSRYDERDYYYDCERIRTEFGPKHTRHGEICFYARNRHVQTQYAHNHPRHGEMNILDIGGRCITLFMKGHEYCGEIRYMKNGILERIEFTEDHKCCTQIRYFDGNNCVRVEHKPGTDYAGQVSHYKDGLLTLVECDGETLHFEDDIWVRTEFAPGHALQGLMLVWDRDDCKIKWEEVVPDVARTEGCQDPLKVVNASPSSI
jgi:hypothetical protein